jgi:peptide/nickel transport system permease protein
MGALIVLGVLYFCAIFAGFLATYEVSTQNLNKSFHPPTFITWKNGGFCVRQYEPDLENPGKYVKIEDSCVPVKFFAKGFPYKLLGVIPMNRHLVQVASGNTADRIYILGSDSMGRDVFSRLLYGAQISLSIGFIGITITMVLGFLVGGLSGYFGGMFDFMSMRFVELLMAIPGLYLLLALRSALAPYFESSQMYLVIVVILSLVGWAGTARIIRGLSLSIAQRQFVLAAQEMGQSTFKILIKHILPNLVSYLLVAATLSIPAYILGEAALSFLGLGIQEPSASWGLMLKQAQQMRVFMLNYWWMFTPGVLIFITVIAFNVLGDALRDIVDPRMKVNGGGIRKGGFGQ